MQRTRFARLAVGLATLSLVIAACSSGGGSSAAPSAEPSAGGGDKGTVHIAINPWVGAEANVAVVKVLLEQLGYTVEAQSVAEEVAWPGFETGEVDVILENWGHPDLEATYITDKGVAQDAGPNGVTGIIGWYVPEWMTQEHPDITDWNTLNGYAELFKTTESGDQGQFLGSDPTFVTNDQALIDNLDLDFKIVNSGSEAASITAFQKATEQKTALIGYFYDPQWVHSQIKLVKVNLPEWTEGCDADPKAVACDYPVYTLNKIVATSFAENGGDAYTLVKNFSWTNEDQNQVAENPSEKYGTYRAWNVTGLMNSTAYVEDGSFMRLRSVTLGYSLPRQVFSKIGFTNMRIYVSGNNLYTWTRYSGLDPEVNFNNSLLTGLDKVSYPRTKDLIVGINASF